MSHANGAVIKNRKVLGYFEYDGTTDVAISAIYLTHREMDKNWRNHDWRKCKCGKPPEEVILYTDYGGGLHWKAKVCLHCGAIVENTMPYESDKLPPHDGLPRGMTTKSIFGWDD